MIQNLILKLASLLVETLASVISNTEQHVKSSPIQSPDSASLPLIALTQGNLSVSQPIRDSTASQPRPAEIRQKVVVNKESPLEPYTLTKIPLQESVQCKVFFNEGTVSEQQVWLQEKKDFTIDYGTKKISFIYDVSAADSILFIYSSVSVFSLREFEQELLVDVYALEMAELEKLASLITGTTLTYHDNLLEAYNQNPTYKTEYNAANVSTAHLLSRILFLEGKLEYEPSLKIGLKFKVAGQIKAEREVTEGFGIIEKIHSPGLSSTHPIDIKINVE